MCQFKLKYWKYPKKCLVILWVNLFYCCLNRAKCWKAFWDFIGTGYTFQETLIRYKTCLCRMVWFSVDCRVVSILQSIFFLSFTLSSISAGYICGDGCSGGNIKEVAVTCHFDLKRGSLSSSRSTHLVPSPRSVLVHSVLIRNNSKSTLLCITTRLPVLPLSFLLFYQ